jgi:polyhydroxybutyrate depolymerase
MLPLLLCAFAWGVLPVLAAEPPAAAAPAPVAPRPSNGKGGKTGTLPNETIDVKGQAREYRLVVPSAASSGKPLPLVFAFHGLGDSKDGMPLYSQLSAAAEKHGFIVVYPNGKDKRWPLAVQMAKDDLEFFDALYAKIGADYNVDLNRVYLTGMSNGAYFTHVVASQRSTKIAAIAPHSGGMGIIGALKPQIEHKYAVLAINGDADKIVPVEQGRTTRDTYTRWGHEIQYVEIPGQAHMWATLKGINETIWTFFEAHPYR